MKWLSAVWLAACATEVPPEVDMRVVWLTGGPENELPVDVTSLEITRTIDGVTEAPAGFTVANLPMREDGSRYLEAPLLRGLPAGPTIEVAIKGTGTMAQYVGVIGPLRLAPGERRHIDLNMYRIDSSIPLGPSEAAARFLHTATALRDGRVLVTGGFDRVSSAACPASLTGATCFRILGSSDAFVFEPGTGTMWPIREGMLEARGGHSATLLPSGRVLVAGGASEAILAFVAGAEAGSFEPVFLPEDEDGEATAHASFEVFLPDRPSEQIDEMRDGDPARGVFAGAATVETSPGSLNDARFMHAAAIDSTTGNVVLAGGLSAPETYEIYDDEKPGGYGVYDNAGAALRTARAMPSAVGFEGRVWIFGGVSAPRSNDDLAEFWEPSLTEPNGSMVLGTTTAFPNETGTSGDRPELALARPSALAVAGTHALVIGWLGPRCAAGTTAPTFDLTATTSCGASEGRSVTVDADSGATSTQDTEELHALAASAALAGGRVVVSGGFDSGALGASGRIEIFGRDVTAGTARRSGTRPMVSARVLHAAAALPLDGVLTLGGITVEPDLSAVEIVGTAEVIYPAPVPFPNGS